MKRFVVSAALFAITVVGASAPVAIAGNQMTVLLDWFVNPDHAPLFVALEKGFFRQKGLTVDFIAPSNPNDPPKLVAAKKAELWQRAKMTEANAECLERLKKAGMQINEIPESELDRFRQVTYEKVFPTVIKNKDLGPNTKELIDMTIWAQQ